jgi:hypothetical protein
MIILLSPSKTIKINPSVQYLQTTQPSFLTQSSKIAKILKTYTYDELQLLLKTSPQLTQTAYDYYQLWNRAHTEQRSGAAILAFRGEAYSGLGAGELSNDTLLYAQQKLLIFSGLYGVLRPFDSIQPYRLDVGDSLLVDKQSLHQCWKNKVTQWTNKQLELQNCHTIINLASLEYFKMIDQKKVKSEIITPIFKDLVGDEYKIVSVFAKQSRGKMARYILENKITNPEHLKIYDENGYVFNESLSNHNQFVYTRG